MKLRTRFCFRLAAFLITFAALLCLSLLGGQGVAGAQQTPPAGRLDTVALALDWYPNATHAGLYAALYEGFFAEEGLELRIVVPQDPATRLSQLALGRVDFALESPGGLLSARAQGMPLVSVMGVIQSFLGAMMTLEDSGIRTVADFEGKRIGTAALPEARARLETVLEAAGVDLAKVEIIDIGWGQTAALLSGAVDVVTGIIRTWQGVEAELEGYDVRFLYWEDYGVPVGQTLVLATTESYIDRREDVVKRFVRAMVRGYEFALEQPERAAAYVLQADPELRPDLVMRSVGLLAPYFKEPEPRVGWHSHERWEAYARWMWERGLLARDVDVRDAFTNRFLP